VYFSGSKLVIFKGKHTFYKRLAYLGRKLQFFLFRWIQSWLMGGTGDSWFSSFGLVIGRG
jgi:hypothetical protein